MICWGSPWGVWCLVEGGGGERCLGWGGVAGLIGDQWRGLNNSDARGGWTLPEGADNADAHISSCVN